MSGKLMTLMSNRINLLIIFWIFFSIALATFLLRDIFWNSGLPYTRDLIFPYDLSTFNHLLSTWDDVHSERNLELNKTPLFFLFAAGSHLFGSELLVKFFLGLVLFLLSFIPFISLLILFKEKIRSPIKLGIICCIPSLLYLFNPWVVDRISNHVFLVLGMALNPLVFVLYVKLLERGAVDLFRTFVIAILLTAISIISTHDIFYLIPGFIFASFYYYIVAGRKPIIDRKKVLLSITIFFSVYVLLNIYWLLPIIYQILLAQIQISPSYAVSIDTIERLSQSNTFINVLQMNGGGAWQSVLQHPSNLSSNIVSLVPFLSFAAIVFFPKNRFIILLGILLVLLFLLSLGTNSPLPIYKWFLASPLSSILWIFRDPSRFISYMVFIYTVLLAFTLYRIVLISDKHKTAKIAVIVFVFVIIVYSPAAYTFANRAGDRLIASQVPPEYNEINEFLQADPGNFKVLWLPSYSYFYYSWNKAGGDEVAGDFYFSSTPKPTYGFSTQGNLNSTHFWGNLYHVILLKHQTNEIGHLLSLYNVKYVIVHTDLYGYQEIGAENALQDLTLQKDMKLSKQIGPYHIFENIDYGHTLGGKNQYTQIFIASQSNTSAIDNSTANAILESFRVQDPTKYFLKVNATKPYLLVFEEPYDPLWIAKINYDGGKSSVYKSTPVYSLLNGFFINKPGEYDVEIMYAPQGWFQVGAYVSVIGLFVICGYLVWQSLYRLKYKKKGNLKIEE
jgi:hypothetical protein